MPYAYQIFIEKGGQKTASLDTAYSASFVFSEDSKYLFAEQSIYDLDKKRLLSDLKTVPFTGRSVGFMAGTHIPITTAVDGVRIWEFPNVRNVKLKRLINFKSSADGKRMVCESYSKGDKEKQFVAIDLSKGKIDSKPIVTKESSFILDVASDGDYFCFLEMKKKSIESEVVDYAVQVYSSKTSKKIKTIKNSTKAFFTNNKNEIIIDSSGIYSFKYDLKSGSMKRFPTDGVESGVYVGGVSNDHSYLMGTKVELLEGDVYGSKVMAWDAITGEKVFEQMVAGTSISSYQISNDHNYFSFASSNENIIYVFNLKTGAKIHELKAHHSIVEVTMFSDDADDQCIDIRGNISTDSINYKNTYNNKMTVK